MAMSASAATVTTITSTTGPTTATVVTTGIKGINESQTAYSLLANANITVNNKSSNLTLNSLSELEVAPGDVIKIPLPGNLFLNANGTAFSEANVALSALNSANISVRTSFTRGADTYTAYLSGNRNGAYLTIEFASGYFLTAQRFTSNIYFAKSGARKASTKITVSGVMQTPTQELGWGDDYADLSDGSAIYTRSAVRNAELYLGDYCTITRSLLKGVSYAGTASANDITNADVTILTRHPAIEYIYKLRTIGLKTTGNIVTFDLSRKYYVYDTNGIYIGTSDKALPYWTKYYLSTKKYESIKVK